MGVMESATGRGSCGGFFGGALGAVVCVVSCFCASDGGASDRAWGWGFVAIVGHLGGAICRVSARMGRTSDTGQHTAGVGKVRKRLDTRALTRLIHRMGFVF